MQIQGIQGIGTAPGVPRLKPAGESAADSFGKLLSQAVTDLNEVQSQADVLTQRVATGADVDLHDVIIAQEQASMSFQLAVQVRNRVLEAYQEIMRMQV